MDYLILSKYRDLYKHEKKYNLSGTLYSRLYLAALHFNENCNKAQLHDKAVKLRWAVSYPKGRDGQAILKKVESGCSYSKFHQFYKIWNNSFTIRQTIHSN